jgi:hypothetical protein
MGEEITGLFPSVGSAFEPFDQLPEPLLRSARSDDPLVQIAAGRVLWRIRWSGDAAVKARAAIEELRESWHHQIEQENFLPPPELRDRLQQVLLPFDDPNRQSAQPFLVRAIENLRRAAQDPALNTVQSAAVRSMLDALTGEIPSYQIPPSDLNALPDACLPDAVVGIFALMNNREFDDPNVGYESALVEFNELYGRFVPPLEPLFDVYLAFSGRASSEWISWLEENGGVDPGWVPVTSVMISWQLASVASWAGMGALLEFLAGQLAGKLGRHHFVALAFCELVIRAGRAGGRLRVFGGGSVAPEVPAWETEPPPAEVLELGPGKILFNPPKRMRVGRTETVEVRVGDLTVDLDVLRQDLSGRGDPQVKDLKIGIHMRVELIGDGKEFTIRALQGRDQMLRIGESTSWDFRVTPRRAGRCFLHLVAFIGVPPSSRRALPTLHEEIRVWVAPLYVAGELWRDHWKKIVGAVAIPLA